MVTTETAGVPLSDAELVASSLEEGGAEAFSTLVTRYKGMVMGRIAAIVKDHHAAEDLAQDTFVRAFRSLAQLEDPAGFASWLGTIARNAALRWTSTRKPVSLDSLPEGEAPTADPAENASRREIHQKVLEAVESLPEAYRGTVYLRYLKGMSCRQIAAVQGIEIGAVTSRLSRAADMLRNKLIPFMSGGRE